MVDSAAIAGTPGVEEVAEQQEVTEAMPEAVAEVSTETPAQTPVDEPVVPKKDLDALRAIEQRQKAEMKAQYDAYIQQMNQQFLEVQTENYKLKTKDMAPEDKAKYDFQLELEKRDRRVAEMEQRLQAQEAERRGYEERERSIQAAMSVGIPRNEVESHANSPQELAQFMQTYMQEAIKSRTQAPPQAPKTSLNRTGVSRSGINANFDKMTPAQQQKIIERAILGGIPDNEL
jgi:hypothetical protein